MKLPPGDQGVVLGPVGVGEFDDRLGGREVLGADQPGSSPYSAGVMRPAASTPLTSASWRESSSRERLSWVSVRLSLVICSSSSDPIAP